MSTNINPNLYTVRQNYSNYNSVKSPQTNPKAQPQFGHAPLSRQQIGLGEGIRIYCSGLVKQGSEIVSAIIKNPVKTLAIAGGTTLGLMALPFIGIPTAVGGGALAIGFAGYSLFKGANHAKEFIKNNKDGTYHIARHNLQRLGEDSVDIALSAPFVPKSVTHIKNFAKHGKIAINTQLVNDLKTAGSMKEQFRIIRNTDKNITRSTSYKNAIEKELAKLEGITDTQKAAIKKDLLEFDVPQEKISEVVIDKWAQIKGIKTKPDIQYKTMPQNIGGIASPKECQITINDFKQKLQKDNFDKYELLSTKVQGDTYINTYRDKATGAIMQDSIEKSVLDAYNNLYKQQAPLAPQSRQILSTVHEREHIHQYAQIYQLKGNQHFTPTQHAADLYKKMVQDMPQVKPGSTQALEIEKLATATNNGTPVSYIKNPREIAARNAEYQALQNTDFQRLDRVFTHANKTSAPKFKNTIILNTARPEAALN